MSVFETREIRGKLIAEKPNQIQRLDDRFYKVNSQSRNGGMYDVVHTKAFAIGWICNCPDFTYRQAKCKHIWAVEFSLALRRRVEQQITIRPVDLLACRFCASKRVVKDAKRFNKYGEIQRYLCKTCGKRFSFNLGFERMKAAPEAITSAMQLYFTGESLRNVQKFLRLKAKYTADITPLFKEGKELTGKAPSTIITDGAFNFDSAFRSAFWRENKALAIQHERHVRMSGDLNNQKMERMNGEVCDREKVVRGLKKENSPLIKGLQIYHNYVRTHEGLNNRTPAEAAGIKVEGQDKWLTIIQNASNQQAKRGKNDLKF